MANLTAAHSAQPALGVRPAWRAILYTAAASAALAGFVAIPSAINNVAAPAADPALIMLLRFMAVVKAAMAIAGIALADWRFRHPASSRLATSYVVASGLMAAGSGLIWHIATIVEGAAVFHTGLALLIVLAWVDRGETQRLFGVAKVRSRSGRP